MFRLHLHLTGLNPLLGRDSLRNLIASAWTLGASMTFWHRGLTSKHWEKPMAYGNPEPFCFQQHTLLQTRVATNIIIVFLTWSPIGIDLQILMIFLDLTDLHPKTSQVIFAKTQFKYPLVIQHIYRKCQFIVSSPLKHCGPFNSYVDLPEKVRPKESRWVKGYGIWLGITSRSLI